MSSSLEGLGSNESESESILGGLENKCSAAHGLFFNNIFAPYVKRVLTFGDGNGETF